MPTCRDCGGVTIEYDAAAGNSFCVQCGTVVEENAIVAEVTFGETSTGAAMVQGSYVGQGQTRARMSGPGGYRGSGESREQTLANARRKIRQVQAALRISEHTGDQALRWYTLAVEHRFTKGRRSEIVVAVCLYVACRMSNTSHMLIDFSDILQLNVFVLGTTYLRLVQTLNIKLPLIDPAHYIHRFAALLEFGDETGKVATDAVRLVQRFNRDWMTAGRRPAGICGASILLAARMNNFRRSVQEIVQVVKIADVTLKKRLEEFKKTASGNLTVDDFRKVWLEEEMDPPAFTRGKEKEERAKVKMTVSNGRRKRKKRRKPGEGEDTEDDAEDEGTQGGSDQDDDERTPGPSKTRAADPSLLNQGILAGTMGAVSESVQSPLFLPDADDETAYRDDKDNAGDHPDTRQDTIDPRLVELSKSHGAISPPESLPQASPIDDALTSFLTKEVSEFIENEQGNLLADALDTAERRRQALITPVDELLGLDEGELDGLILSEEEVKVKERIWVELNREYLENIAAKALKEQNGESAPVRQRKRRKTGGNKPRDASNAHGKTAAESVRNFMTKSKKFSRKINYSAYDTLFGGGIGTEDSKDDDDKDDDDDGGGGNAGGLIAFDEKSDGGDEYVLVVEEGGGEGVGTQRARGQRSVGGGGADGGGGGARPESDEEELDAEGEKAEDTWGMDDDDAYQQEV